VGVLRVVAAVALFAAAAHAQDGGEPDTTHLDPVISLGNTAGVNGLRLNFRDSRLDRVNGVNLTVWLPKGQGKGTVNGLALGVPATGAFTINGLGVGAGLEATHNINGVLVSGLGSVALGTVTGVSVSGLATAGGQSLVGINVGGLGVLAGQSLWGLNVGGLAALSAGHITGITIAGLAAGAPIVRGILIAGAAAGGSNVTGAVIAPLYIRIANGQFTGGSIGAVNDIRGELHGVTIGIFNYARSLHGVQLGLLNIAGNNHGLARILPLLNFHP
jgi:hypothetical protein